MIKISLPTAIPMSLLVLWCLGFAIDAEAGLKICNRSSHVIWLALAEGKDAQPRAHGWYGLDVGTCQTFYGAKLNNRYYYGYAFDTAGNVWEGDFQFCLHPQVSFTIHGDDVTGLRHTKGYISARFTLTTAFMSQVISYGLKRLA
ncbi:hypothetical protein C2W62_15795 [Candidatus Entotheonella serta]|nr:hypothetical protein C2W62_15795 [Candidatus Entotheonella serta]